MKEKELDISAIRGVMILWVIIVHISLDYGLISDSVPMKINNPFLWMSFYMFSFYFFSGYFYKPGRRIDDILRRKSKSLLIPCLFFTAYGVLVYEIYSIYTVGHLSLFSFKSILRILCLPTNSPLWFFVSLFTVSVLFSVADALDTRMKSAFWGGYLFKIGLSLTCAAIVIVTCNRLQLFGWGNVALGLLVYYAGYLFKLYSPLLSNRLWLIVSFVIFMFIPLIYPCQLDFCVIRLAQGNIVLDFIWGVSACIMFRLIFGTFPKEIWNKAPYKVFPYLGEVSLVVFAAHRPLLCYVIEPILDSFEPRIQYGLYITVSFVAVLFAALILNILLERFIPKMIGK